MTTAIGVVIPAYNPGRLLHRSLRSLVAQTRTDWQAVVVDDGSAEDLGWVAGVDARITLVRQPNSGVSRARNAGAALLHTPYLAFLDQDDEWLPTKLEKQAALLEASPTAAFCHTEFEWVLPQGAVHARYPRELDYLTLLAYHHVLLSSLVVRREDYWTVGGHDPLLQMVQDHDLFLRLTMNGARAVCVHEPLVRYHVHGGNASSDYLLTHREMQHVISGHRTRAVARRDRAAVEAAAAGAKRAKQLYAEQAVQAARAGSPSRSAPHLARALVWDPQIVLRSASRAAIARVRAAGT